MRPIQIVNLLGCLCLALAQNPATLNQDQNQQEQGVQSPALLDLLAAQRDQRLLSPALRELSVFDRARYNRPLTPSIAPVTTSALGLGIGNGVVAVRSENENTGDGNFRYGYELSDGQRSDVSGFLKPNPEARAADGEDSQIQVMQGSYSYISPEGVPITVNWIADELGFRVSGSNIPASAGVYNDLNVVPTNAPVRTIAQSPVTVTQPIPVAIPTSQPQNTNLRVNDPYNRFRPLVNNQLPLAYNQNQRPYNNNGRYVNQNQLLLNQNRPLIR